MGGPKGGPTNDMNSMLTGLGMSGMVGQDQQGMQRAGLQGLLGGIGQGLMQSGGGAGGTLAGLSQGLAQGMGQRDAAMFRYAANPERQAAAQQAINQIPGGLIAPSLSQQPAWTPPAPEYDFQPSGGLSQYMQTMTGGGLSNLMNSGAAQTPVAMPGGGGGGGAGGGGMFGGGFSGAGMAGRPGGASILDLLRQMGAGGGF